MIHKYTTVPVIWVLDDQKIPDFHCSNPTSIFLFLITGFCCPFYGLFWGGAAVGNIDRISRGRRTFRTYFFDKLWIDRIKVSRFCATNFSRHRIYPFSPNHSPRLETSKYCARYTFLRFVQARQWRKRFEFWPELAFKIPIAFPVAISKKLVLCGTLRTAQTDWFWSGSRPIHKHVGFNSDKHVRNFGIYVPGSYEMQSRNLCIWSVGHWCHSVHAGVWWSESVLGWKWVQNSEIHLERKTCQWRIWPGDWIFKSSALTRDS